MKKLLMTGLIIAGLILSNSAAALAHAIDSEKCAKCAEQAQKCKTSKLKKKVKLLWINKEVLDISEDQLNKIKDIKHAAIKKLIQLKADKEIVMVDLKSAMWEESIDVEAVNKLVDDKYAAKNKTAKTYIKAIADIQIVLSKEQRTKWNEMLKKVELSGNDCARCAAASEGKFCPLTGKPLDGKGSAKGSMK